MSSRNTSRKQQPLPKQPKSAPILWTRVLVGFALNVMIVTLGLYALADMSYGLLLTLVGPVIIGALMGFVIPHRPGVHIFLSGMLSIPFLALVVLPGPISWPYAILAGGICALAGLLVDLFRRVGRRMEGR